MGYRGETVATWLISNHSSPQAKCYESKSLRGVNEGRERSREPLEYEIPGLPGRKTGETPNKVRFLPP